MVQDTTKFFDMIPTNFIDSYDELVMMMLNQKVFWEDKIDFLCSTAVNFEAAKMYGKKVQHCQNNAYILKQGNTYLFYSESKLVSGLMFWLASVFNGSESEVVQKYQPKFLQLLVDIVPDQTINNLLKAFREA